MTGASFQVREAVPGDAAAMLAHVHRLCDEPGVCITLARDVFTMTEDEERAFVAAIAAAPNSVCLVAEADGTLIGLLVAQGGKRRSVRHEAVLALSVA
jgi:hypothetical protein